MDVSEGLHLSWRVIEIVRPSSEGEERPSIFRVQEWRRSSEEARWRTVRIASARARVRTWRSREAARAWVEDFESSLERSRGPRSPG